MCNTRRLLLGLWLCFCSSALYAQVTVEVIISGVEAKLEENIRLFLSIEQQKEHPLMSEGRLRRLHKKVITGSMSASNSDTLMTNTGRLFMMLHPDPPLPLVRSISKSPSP